MSFPKTRKRMGKHKGAFKPDREFVKKALSNYLQNGGEISRIHATERSLKSFLKANFRQSEVDEFLVPGSGMDFPDIPSASSQFPVNLRF